MTARGERRELARWQRQMERRAAKGCKRARRRVERQRLKGVAA
jgi:hypothetical protein